MTALARYSGARILITGGLGFIGSNLAHRLCSLGARVTLLDSLAPLYGGNWANLDGIREQVTVEVGDIRDDALVRRLVRDADVVFNLAAQVSYIDSNRMPFVDLDLNCRGHLTVLEAVREAAPAARVVFASSRLVLGRTVRSPVGEDHPTEPRSLYAIHKLTGEKYHRMYAQVHGLWTAVLRLANPYGERQQIKHDKYSLPGWFMRLAYEGRPITIFGDGMQLRDYVHVADVVEAFLAVGVAEVPGGQVFNCGSGKGVPFRDMVQAVVAAVGRGRIEHVPWPADYERIETGDVALDVDKLSRATGWRPCVGLEDGVTRMFSYYRSRMAKYV